MQRLLALNACKTAGADESIVIPTYVHRNGDKTSMLRRNKRNGDHLVAHSFLVPDITPAPGQPEALVRASVEAALSMPLWEVAARTAVEIALIIIAAKVVITFVERLGIRAEQVTLTSTRHTVRSCCGQL